MRWPSIAPESDARWFVERTALLLTASIMLRYGPDAIADAFVATRLSGDRGRFCGAVGALDCDPVLSRLAPDEAVLHKA